MAEQPVNPPLGEMLQAQGGKSLQECLDIMIPALLEKLHGHEQGTSRPTYYNACARGLRGRSEAIECTICEGSRPMDAHVGTFMKAKLSLEAHHTRLVGDALDRVQALQDQQPQRDTLCVALLGKDGFQLWQFKTDRRGRCLQSTSSPMRPFSLEIDSPGFQLFVRWLTTDLKTLGFISPSLPGVVAPSGMVVDGVIAGNDSSDAAELSEERPSARVFRVQKENNEAAVAKIPASSSRCAREEANLEPVQTLPGLKDRATVLAGAAKLQLGQGVLDALIIKPYAEHIPLDVPYQQLVLYMRQYVGTVERLYRAGYLHRNLSYSNLLISGDRAIISDWETMSRVEEQEAAVAPEGLQTGDALFAAVSTLKGGPHTLSSELETLFNAMLYTLSGGVLQWQGMKEDDRHLLIPVRFGAMNAMIFDSMLERVERECWPALKRLRDVFFGSGDYHTGVTCQDFLNAL